jgi:hypothetical protein
MKRGQLVNHLIPYFSPIPLDEITQAVYEDGRLTLPLTNSTKNDITVVINQIMKEAVRDEIIKVNQYFASTRGFVYEYYPLLQF